MKTQGQADVFEEVAEPLFGLGSLFQSFKFFRSNSFKTSRFFLRLCFSLFFMIYPPSGKVSLLGKTSTFKLLPVRCTIIPHLLFDKIGRIVLYLYTYEYFYTCASFFHKYFLRIHFPVTNIIFLMCFLHL
ncbi:hypothetical protein SAMN05216352_10664 [Alteribacillus bidgolensis]|uniref:Uncharacterized protein n=1 Tax=Alteribacillus bidgolensis TaxID=930129 RepID=A0A1G8J6J3_9BACI|nr:hypothetical protein SAMN05216352_10664 [Alteribacillus bidgolensis]